MMQQKPSFVNSENFKHSLISIQPSKNQQNLISSQLSFDDKALIQLHKIFGNRWKQISYQFNQKQLEKQSKSDTLIKNHFYSLLRKSLRKLNSYIKSNIKNLKKWKPFKLNFVFKLANLAQSQRNIFCDKNKYKDLLYKFLNVKNQITQYKGQQRYFKNFQNNEIDELISSLRNIEKLFLQFNLNKKGKSKKKCPKKLLIKKNLIQMSQNFIEIHSRIKSISNLSESTFNFLDEFSSQKNSIDSILDINFEEYEAKLDLIEQENQLDPILFK